jgi:hypothetical protein
MVHLAPFTEQSHAWLRAAGIDGGNGNGNGNGAGEPDLAFLGAYVEVLIGIDCALSAS